MANLVADDYFLTRIGAMLGVTPTVRKTTKRERKRLDQFRIILGASENEDIAKIVDYKPRIVRHMFLQSAESIEKVKRITPKGDLSANLAVYKALLAMVRMISGAEKIIGKECKKNNSLIDAAAASATNRWVVKAPGVPRAVNELVDDKDSVANLLAIRDALFGLLRKARKTTETAIDKWKASAHSKEFTPEIITEVVGKKDHLKATSIGGIDVITIGKETFVLTSVHSKKLEDLATSFANIMMSLYTIETRYGPYITLVEWARQLVEVAEFDPEFVGECVKGARALHMARMEKDRIFGAETMNLVVRQMDPDRYYYAKDILATVGELIIGDASIYNFLNLYKVTAHPDVNLELAMESLQGLKTPNFVDPANVDRFEAVIRKALFDSLTSSGHQVRMYAQNENGARLSEMSRAAQINKSVMLAMRSSQWSATTFESVRAVTTAENSAPRPTDKASNRQHEITPEEEALLQRWAAHPEQIDRPRVTSNISTINDAASVLKGDSDWNMKAAVKRFETIKKFHEKFESKYTNIDAIPSEDLARFIKENPDASYLVGTEPKLGEYHKKVTRMFYMAEQDLKMLTQSVERVAKQVSRKQPGVSIVKSFSSRRRDLEDFAAAVKGGEIGAKSLFISFDMSEFSKKFPMVLVRKYGQILSEITGEEWLKRIDLFFRSAYVMHNSRGFYDSVVGIKGGFEGFLNFVWSSIHAAIMTIALEDSGLYGSLLTFSDDGLLLLFVPPSWTNEDVAEKIRRIQSTYQKMGLVFHIGKTLCSYHMWEYLGDVCYKGGLLPAWTKEVSGIGREENKRGLSPVRMRINSIVGQASAAVTAGFDPTMAYIIAYIAASKILLPMIPTQSIHTLSMLLMIPTSCGGMRIPSPYELCTSTTVTETGEFISDLYVMSAYNMELTQVIIGNIMRSLVIGKDAFRSLLMGTFVKTNHPDTSGLGVINEAIDAAGDSTILVKDLAENPLTAAAVKKIYDILMCGRSIMPEIITAFILATPAWSMYTESCAMLQGSGAIRLVKRDVLKRLQAKDTKLVKMSFQDWHRALKESSERAMSVGAFYTYINNRIHTPLDLATIRISPRAMLHHAETETHSKEVIQVLFSPGLPNRWTDQRYLEPRMKFPIDRTMLAWSAETTSDLELSGAKKFASLAAKVLSAVPAAQDMVQAIAAVFGVGVPTVPRGVAAGFHRRAKGLGVTTDARIMIPRYFWGQCKSRYLVDAMGRLREIPRADRTTLTETAKVLAYYLHSVKAPIYKPNTMSPEEYIFYSDPAAFESFVSTPDMETIRPVGLDIPVPPVPQRLQDEFRLTMMEHERALEYLDDIDAAAFGETFDDPIKCHILMSLVTKSLEKWIIYLYSAPGNIMVRPTRLPSIPGMKRIVLYNAITHAAWTLLDPTSRGLCARAISYTDLAGGAMTSALRPEALEYNATAVTNYQQMIYGIINSLINFNHPTMTEQDLNFVGETTDDIARVILQQVTSEILTTTGQELPPELQITGGNQPVPKGVVITTTAGYHAGMMSPSHESAFRHMFTHTLSAMETLLRENRWSPNEVAAFFNIPRTVEVDEVIDWIYVTRSLIRASQHRTIYKPYNYKASLITYVKFNVCLDEILGDRNLSVDSGLEYARNWTLNEHQQSDLLAEFPEIGEDHARMIREPLNLELINRIKAWIQLKLSDNLKEKARQPNISSYVQAGVLFAAYFYNAFIRATADNLHVITPSTETEILKIPRLPSRLLYDAIGLSISEVYIGGRQLREDEVLNDDRMMDIVGAHVYELTLTVGFLGLNSSGSALCRSILRDWNIIDRQGVRIFTEGHDRGMQVICRQFDQDNEALATFLTLSMSTLNSVSVFKDMRSLKYYVVGAVMTPKELVPTDNNAPEITLPIDVTPDSIIAEIDVANVNYLWTLGVGKEHRAFEDAPVDFPTAVVSFARREGAGMQVNLKSAEIEAAISIARGATTAEEQLWAYVVLFSYVNDGDRILRFNQLYTIMRRGSPADKARLCTDISTIFFWLNRFRITQALDISVHGVSEIMAMRPRVGNTPLLPVVVNAYPLMPIQRMEDARESGVDLPSIGRFAEWLIRPPPMVNAIEDEDEPVLSLSDVE